MIDNYYCNKCEKKFNHFDEMNENEQDEFIENGDFVCSDCINKEMELEE